MSTKTTGNQSNLECLHRLLLALLEEDDGEVVLGGNELVQDFIGHLEL